jgi:tRNA(fMet)-specific endonuclease VapC
MKYLIDTNVLIEIENNNLEVIQSIDSLRKTNEDNIFISIFTFSEFYYGILRKSPKNKERIVERLNDFDLINTSKQSGIIFCEILSHLKETGKIIPQFDVFIAALAIENDLTLITLDEHFKEIPNLKVIMLKIRT